MLDIKACVKLTYCVTVVLATCPLAAQQTDSQTTRKPGDLDAIRKAGSLIGMDVMNHANTKIANLRDLALSREGVVQYAVLGFGGVAGVGETYTAVPFKLLGVRNDDGKWAVNLDMTAGDLKLAPVIKSENYHELWDPQWIARVDQFVRAHGDSKNHPGRSADAEQHEQRSIERHTLVTKIRAASLKNPENQDLGKVEDLLLDRMNRVIFVIVGRGGVLGIGENYIPVPWSKLRIAEIRASAAITAVIDTTKAKLETAPIVKGDNYATLLAPGFAEQVRQYFGVTDHDDTTSSVQVKH